jgi:hypothetical protein
MKVKTIVNSLLAENVPLRSSDKKLLLAYWRMQGLVLNPEQTIKFMDCTPAESITRARRDLAYKYPASEAVQKERLDKQREYNHNYSPKAISWLSD